MDQNWLRPEDLVNDGSPDLLHDSYKAAARQAAFTPRHPRKGIRHCVACVRFAPAALQDFTGNVFDYFNQVARDESCTRRKRKLKIDYQA